MLQDCGRKLSVGNEWENKVRLALNAQTQGKAYFSSNYWAKAESTANNRLKFTYSFRVIKVTTGFIIKADDQTNGNSISKLAKTEPIGSSSVQNTKPTSPTSQRNPKKSWSSIKSNRTWSCHFRLDPQVNSSHRGKRKT